MRYHHTSKSPKSDDDTQDDTQDDTVPARPGRPRDTMKMCRFMAETDPPCYGPYRWQLCGDGGKYVVCDAHLAMAIRKCDLPARIDRPLDGDDVMSVKFLSKRNPLPKP